MWLKSLTIPSYMCTCLHLYMCIYAHMYMYAYMHTCICMHIYMHLCDHSIEIPDTMGWLRLVGAFKLQVSFAKEPYKREVILQKRPINLRSLLIVATPYLVI